MLNCKIAAFLFAVALIFVGSALTFQATNADSTNPDLIDRQLKTAEEQQDLLLKIVDAVQQELYQLELITNHVEGTRNSTYSSAKRLINLRTIVSVGFVMIILLLLVIVFQLKGIAKNLAGARLSEAPVSDQVIADSDQIVDESGPVSKVELVVVSVLLFSIVTIAVIYVAL
jgi:hypothetical protein